MEQCRKRFGSSVADQQCKRKKKRNAQKELKRKPKKGKEQVHVPTCSEKEPNKEEEERSVVARKKLNTNTIQYTVALIILAL